MKIPVSEIIDQDVESIIKKLGLETVDSARKEFIKCLDTTDVSACPGSGKTTLIVAKMLLLMEKWQSPSRGICVLSHTNVAKDEVISRLSRMGSSYDINGQPHFVGTIHGFIAKYITTPFLVSMGFRPEVIDDDFALNWRRRHIGRKGSDFFKFHPHTRLNDIRLMQVSRSEPFGDKLVDRPGMPRKSSDTYNDFAYAYWESIESGILTYDEVLVFAQKALNVCPEIVRSLRDRFPFVVVDEAQDCTSIQLNLLHQAFEEGDHSSIIQRVGDPNQAIYSDDNATGSIQANVAASFPRANYFTIADSQRLNVKIASIANLLAINKIEGGLRGNRNDSTVIPPYFIIFDDKSINKVLSIFTDIVSRCISSEELAEQGKIAAVGHRIRGEGNKTPYSIRDYFSAFSAEARRRQVPRFGCFVEYVLFARKIISSTGVYGDGVDILATGVFRSLEKNEGSELSMVGGNGPYRKLITLLEEKGIDSASIMKSFTILLCGSDVMNDHNFGDLLDNILTLVPERERSKTRNELACFYCMNSDDGATAHDTGHESKTVFGSSINVYSNKGINVQLDSIHAVKGETHMALLLLDTYSRTYFVSTLLKKLLNKSGRLSETETRKIREGFVAFTRPTHLLAVAAPKDSLGKNDAEITKVVEKLGELGWIFDDSLCPLDRA